MGHTGLLSLYAPIFLCDKKYNFFIVLSHIANIFCLLLNCYCKKIWHKINSLCQKERMQFNEQKIQTMFVMLLGDAYGIHRIAFQRRRCQ